MTKTTRAAQSVEVREICFQLPRSGDDTLLAYARFVLDFGGDNRLRVDGAMIRGGESLHVHWPPKLHRQTNSTKYVHPLTSELHQAVERQVLRAFKDQAPTQPDGNRAD